MSIPSTFYRRFRYKTSLMALGTGVILGSLATIFIPPFLGLLYRLTATVAGGVITVVVNQWVVHMYFSGKKRGMFEFVYRETILDDLIDSEISAVRPSNATIDLELESLALYKALMTRAKMLPEEQQFTCFMAAAKVANIGGEDRNSIEALRAALQFKPSDIVANFKLARAFERIGAAQEAIDAYDAALHDPSIDTEKLKGFIAAQAQRLREKGPEQRSPIPGIIYQLM